MLGKFSVPGRPTSLDDSRARAYCACSRCGWGLFGHFFPPGDLYKFTHKTHGTLSNIPDKISYHETVDMYAKHNIRRGSLVQSGPEVIKLFTCSTQRKFLLLINVEMQTSVGISTFMARKRHSQLI